MDTVVKTSLQSRLVSAITSEGFLFHFPNQFGTPELLQLAMRCEGKLAVAYASPGARHLASTFVEGLEPESPLELGLTTLPEAQKRSAAAHAAGLAYFSCPLDDAKLIQLTMYDAHGVALGVHELRHLALDSQFVQTKHYVRVAQSLAPVDECQRGSLLVDSPSHAVRTAMLESLSGEIELVSREATLAANPREAMQRSDADWGVWIDADGASMEFFDRLGAPLNVEQVFESLAAFALPRASTIVLEKTASIELAARLKEAGHRIIRCPSTRREMAIAMRVHGALLGGGVSGRVWFGGEIPVADAMLAARLWLRGASLAMHALQGDVRALSRPAA